MIALEQLLAGVELVSVTAGPGVEVTGLEFDSRCVQPGSAFVALRGEVTDGNLYIGQALERGAAAIVTDAGSRPEARGDGAWINVADAHTALATMARNFYGAPDDQLLLVGVTGTNGKTSVAHILRHLLQAAVGPTGMIGTISYCTGSRQRPASLTTPEAPEIARLLRLMVDEGCRAAVMEASSVAAHRQRVRGLSFDAMIFTNFSRDHLDYHGDMESYYLAKRSLFRANSAGRPRAIVNADDEWGRRLAGEVDLPLTTFAFERDALVRGSAESISLAGTGLRVRWGETAFSLRSSLLGRPNAQNLLAATATALALGAEPEVISQEAPKIPVVRGRLERVTEGLDFDVLVDYAHTDDALLNLLLAAQELIGGGGGRIITVFGCGGDRDRGKRPLMGRHAARHSDVALLTSDNPRSENPADIIAEVEAGIADLEPSLLRAACRTIPDRREAIFAAVEMARAGDLVLIAGKGHEDYQIIGERKLHFDDREVVQEAVASR